MTTRFVCVQEAPETINPSKELVVYYPNFLDEIESSKRFAAKTAKNSVTSVIHLRHIVIAIANALNIGDQLPNIPYSQFEGIAYSSSKELSSHVIIPMMERYWPIVFSLYMDRVVTNRKKNVDIIYYIGPYSLTGSFTKYGISEMSSKELKKSNKNKEIDVEQDKE